MIVRAPRDHHYTVIDNRPSNDASLSWEARGLLTYLLTKPDGWTVRPAHLVSQGPAGRDAVYAILRELREAGYIVMHKLADGTVSYEVHEAPPSSGNSVTGASSGKAISGQAARLVNTETAVKTEKKKKREGKKKRVVELIDPATCEIPKDLPRKTWVDWCQCRADKGKPISATTFEYQMRRLASLRNAGHSPDDVVSNSIEKQYEGLYPALQPTNGFYPRVVADDRGPSLAELDLPPG